MHLDSLQPHVSSNCAKLAEEFRAARPFPYLVIDGFLNDELCARLLAQFPHFGRGSALNEDGRPGGKAVCEQVRELGPAFSQIDDLVRSPEFLDLVGDMTGIRGLLYDPDYIGGGTHENRANQELSPHVDFNYHPARGWHRRLNLIVYLNPVWEPEWGGALELHSDPWRPAGEDQVTAVVPSMNRCVIFETSERSWHGFRRIVPPADQPTVSRRSFAIYLYSRDRPAAEIAPPHATVYVERPLPDAVRAGATLSRHDSETIDQLIARRNGHIDRLVRREHEFAETIRRYVRRADEWRPLTAAQSDSLHWLVARQDEHLKYLYEREKLFTDRVRDMEEEVGHTFPLRGPVTLTGDLSGFWSDGWAGEKLHLRIEPVQPISELRIAGHVAEQFADGQELTLTIGERTWARHVDVGPFEWVVPVALQPPVEQAIQLLSRHVWRPSTSGASDDGRDLAWYVGAIEAVGR